MGGKVSSVILPRREGYELYCLYKKPTKSTGFLWAKNRPYLLSSLNSHVGPAVILRLTGGF